MLILTKVCPVHELFFWHVTYRPYCHNIRWWVNFNVNSHHHKGMQHYFFCIRMSRWIQYLKYLVLSKWCLKMYRGIRNDGSSLLSLRQFQMLIEALHCVTTTWYYLPVRREQIVMSKSIGHRSLLDMRINSFTSRYSGRSLHLSVGCLISDFILLNPFTLIICAIQLEIYYKVRFGIFSHFNSIGLIRFR